MNKKLRVYLVDDHDVVREGLKRILEKEPTIEVVGEADNAAAALIAIPELCPNVVVMDLSMPEMNGARATRILREKAPFVAILILTVHEDKSYLRELLEAGATGYVLKRTAGDDLIRAIRIVAAGEVYIDPRIAGKMVDSVPIDKNSCAHLKVKLSEREATVLRLIAQGYSNKEIGAQLKLSVKTIETYKGRSMEKLGLRSRVDVVRYAHELGWLADESSKSIPLV